MLFFLAKLAGSEPLCDFFTDGEPFLAATMGSFAREVPTSEGHKCLLHISHAFLL